eukprot:Lithocolla_globosa_v1_NODE_11901_length_473_cov_6.181818.p1 type:complete len:106 gc:universal NODE_11901_length_473_cov_6.181818:84-401(+)
MDDTPKHIKLISSDGFEFIIDRKSAMVSGTIKNILTGPGQFAEARNNEIVFRDISSPVLEKVCEYFCYKHKYEVPGSPPDGELPDFAIEPEIALELLMAAHFLET